VSSRRRNRVVLKHFTDAQLRTPGQAPGGTAANWQDVPLFPHPMLIDGNDDRGIDVPCSPRTATRSAPSAHTSTTPTPGTSIAEPSSLVGPFSGPFDDHPSAVQVGGSIPSGPDPAGGRT